MFVPCSHYSFFFLFLFRNLDFEACVRAFMRVCVSKGDPFEYLMSLLVVLEVILPWSVWWTSSLFIFEACVCMCIVIALIYSGVGSTSKNQV